MKKNEMKALKRGDKVTHEQYGVCSVDEQIPGSGVKITPDTIEGRLQLVSDVSKMPKDVPLLETDNSLLSFPAKEEVSTKEDMIVYWNSRGEPLARVIFMDGEDLEAAEEYLYPAMMDVFGKDEQLNDIVDNSSYEDSKEWE